MQSVQKWKQIARRPLSKASATQASPSRCSKGSSSDRVSRWRSVQKNHRLAHTHDAHDGVPDCRCLGYSHLHLIALPLITLLCASLKKVWVPAHSLARPNNRQSKAPKGAISACEVDVPFSSTQLVFLRQNQMQPCRWARL